jgi:hypothetical protein
VGSGRYSRQTNHELLLENALSLLKKVVFFYIAWNLFPFVIIVGTPVIESSKNAHISIAMSLCPAYLLNSYFRITDRILIEN